MRRQRLSRQIIVSMSVLATIAMLIVFVGSFIFYGIYLTYFPTPTGPPPLLPEASDLVLMAVFLLIGLALAILVSLRLAKRILTPLNSLAESARKIAAGDLSARAAPGDRSLGETAQLVDDFNAMAQRLQDIAEDMIAWNAAIAHELRTPLTILKGRLQGIADGVFAPDEALIRNLLLQVDGLSRLVEDLRTVTLADGGHLDLRLEKVELAAEICGVADLLEPSLRKAGFSLDVTLIDLVVRGDAVRIRQALLALLDNAQRYALPGSIELAIMKSGNSAIIRVEDDGPALSPDFAKRAFEPFARSEQSRSRRLGGSGLGLSVVRAIAEAHGGQVSYRKSSRGGAVFEITLPLDDSACHVAPD
ncbi:MULTISPECIES: ATP-binding protein [Rhodopseudomonas]|uniref:histidine kinase n=1 Tax=Rhodopseudomonas palustris TaxID=1076 RepID=A0A0D7ES21_RHOPL|nr:MULTISPECIES: ATP-binding protein [Rhodopseudomonas]KIZ43345.1 histidine kinase [Rhodopseudomonas palustris]MDF3811266.1 ATP-binding protein [Rhodopseudomonas sp. BAL398]WOK18591.1 ATP-binding protein [Rhodopseudomonas sp. BAL398]